MHIKLRAKIVSWFQRPNSQNQRVADFTVFGICSGKVKFMNVDMNVGVVCLKQALQTTAI